MADNVSDTLYGHRRGSLWPLALVVTTVICLLAVLLADAAVFGLVGVVSSVLLGIWVGGSGR